MSNFFKTVTIKWLQSILELVIYFPVILLFCLITLPQDKLWYVFMSLTLYSLIGIILRKLFYTHFKFIVFFMGVPLIIIGNIYILNTSPYLIASIPLSLIFFYRGVRSAERTWDMHFPIQLYWFGLIAYFLCYCLTYLMGYQEYLNTITYLGLASVFAFLFMNNHEQLKWANMSDSTNTKIPKSILKSNRIFICFTFLLLVLLSQIKLVKSILLLPFILIIQFFNFIGSFVHINNIMPSETPTPPQQTSNSIIHWLYLVFNFLVQIAGYIVSIILVIAIVIAFVKISKSLVHWFLGLLKLKQGQDTTTGYTDEKERLLDIKFITPQLNRIRDWLQRILEKEPQWEDLKDNRERIRYIYRHFILRSISEGYAFKKHLTPTETFDDITQWDKNMIYKMVHLTVGYNKARYGNCEIPDHEIENIMKNVDHLRGK